MIAAIVLLLLPLDVSPGPGVSLLEEMALPLKATLSVCVSCG